MTDTPDYHALAELWLQRDPRSHLLGPEERRKIVHRLADALRARREASAPAYDDVGLIVNVPRADLQAGQGLSEEALEQLTEFLRERIEDEHGTIPPDGFRNEP